MNKTPKAPKTPYDVLGVDVSATQNQIKQAYRTLAKDTHPDTNNGVSGGFEEIKKAYEVLSDPKRRMVYDNLNGMVKKSAQAGSPFIDPDAFRNYWKNTAPGYISGQWGYGSSNTNSGTYARQFIRIPRGTIFSVRNTGPGYQYSPAIDIEVDFDMRGIPWFGPGDRLLLEFNYAGGSTSAVEIEVTRVDFTGATSGGHGVPEAHVIGFRI